MNTRLVIFLAVLAVVALAPLAHSATEQGMVELNGSAAFVTAAFVTAVGEYAGDVSVHALSTQVTYFTSDALSVFLF